MGSTNDTSTSAAGKSGQSANQTNPFEPLIAAWLEQSKMWQPDNFADTLGNSPLFDRGPAAMWPVAAVLMQTYFQCISSSVRFGGRLTDKMAQCQARMIERLAEADVASAADGESMRILIDDARACLREVAELSAAEAKALKTNIETLDETLRSLAGDVPEPSSATRHWKVKP